MSEDIREEIARRCRGRLVGPPRGHQCLRHTTDPSGFCAKHRSQARADRLEQGDPT